LAVAVLGSAETKLLAGLGLLAIFTLGDALLSVWRQGTFAQFLAVLRTATVDMRTWNAPAVFGRARAMFLADSGVKAIEVAPDDALAVLEAAAPTAFTGGHASQVAVLQLEVAFQLCYLSPELAQLLFFPVGGGGFASNHNECQYQ